MADRTTYKYFHVFLPLVLVARGASTNFTRVSPQGSECRNHAGLSLRDDEVMNPVCLLSERQPLSLQGHDQGWECRQMRTCCRDTTSLVDAAADNTPKDGSTGMAIGGWITGEYKTAMYGQAPGEPPRSGRQDQGSTEVATSEWAPPNRDPRDGTTVGIRVVTVAGESSDAEFPPRHGRPDHCRGSSEEASSWLQGQGQEYQGKLDQGETTLAGRTTKVQLRPGHRGKSQGSDRGSEGQLRKGDIGVGDDEGLTQVASGPAPAQGHSQGGDTDLGGDQFELGDVMNLMQRKRGRSPTPRRRRRERARKDEERQRRERRHSWTTGAGRTRATTETASRRPLDAPWKEGENAQLAPRGPLRHRWWWRPRHRPVDRCRLCLHLAKAPLTSSGGAKSLGSRTQWKRMSVS